MRAFVSTFDILPQLIEPYSLRRTNDGYLLLYAVKAMTGELRAYRVDRIQSIQVTTTTFRPRYPIEFTSAGSMVAPLIQKTGSLRVSSKPSKSGVVYVFECSYCGKRFKRTTYDTRLRPHKDKGGVFDCPGRVGYEVDRHYQ